MFDIDEFITAIKTSANKRQAVEKLGWPKNGYSNKRLARLAHKYDIDISHLKVGRPGYQVNRPTKISLVDILVENSSYSSTSELRKRLIKEGLMEERCLHCGITEWMGVAAPLELDHINGNNRDNRIQNLRILCSNCHCILPTSRGRNSKKFACVDCGKVKLSKENDRCGVCSPLVAKDVRIIEWPKDPETLLAQVNATSVKEVALKLGTTTVSVRRFLSNHNLEWNKPTKIVWPSDDDLVAMVESTNYVQTAKTLGVSDVAVRKRVKKIKAQL